MKILKPILSIFLLLTVSNLFGQYLETFTTPEKGILVGGTTTTSGCPTNDPTTCGSFDFIGVDWTINGDLSLVDINDYVKTLGGHFEFHGDVDEEVCWESPVLDISSAGGVVSLSVDAVWNGHDAADYMDVEYRMDGGAWIQIPNQFGGGTHTIDSGAGGYTGSGTVTVGGLVGSSTMSVRVCQDSNTSSEIGEIDNVNVPEAGVILLPVTWGDVRVDSKKSKNMIHWSTYSEINNDRFEIEHTSNLERPWLTLGTLDSNGDTYRKSNYSFADEFITSPVNYYRIKQIDLDGQFDYSEIVLSRNDLGSDIKIFPNPADDYIIVRSSIILDDNQQFLVYDAMGRLINLSSSKESDYSLKLNSSSLEAGIYFIKLSSGNMRKVIKL
jgi:hypothetical protein